MKREVKLFAWFAALVACAGLILFEIDWSVLRPLPSGFVTIDPQDQMKTMPRGVNILGFDPLWKDFTKARFKERHFARIRDAGFRSVRINLQAFSHMDRDNHLDHVWFKTLDWVIENALANGLIAILDEHDSIPCGEDPVSCKPRLMAFWEQVAERYKNVPNSVLFEILNEPNEQLTPELWNAWIKDALAIIRKTNPTRNVVIGPAMWNAFDKLDELELPEGDRNLVVTVHYYLPESFTHQGAPWNKKTAHLSGITWGTEAEKRVVDEDFSNVRHWSAVQNRPVLLGEFGAWDGGGADLGSRVRYTTHVARTAESLGMPWIYWQFDADFIAYDMVKDDWVQPIRKALIP